MSASLSGLSLRDLEYVTAVARHLHFGRAAEACGVSQPALSVQVRKLERYLGFTLFERMPSGTRMTEAGAEFAVRAADLVTAARDLLAVSTVARTRTGPFRLGAIPTLGPYLLPYAIRPIRLAFPELRLLFTEARTSDLLLMLREGKLDVVLVCMPPADPALEQHALFTEPLLLMHPPDAPPDSPLLPDQLLTLEDGHCLRDHVIAACGMSFASADRHATGLDLLHQMVAAGEGVSFVPALAAARLGRAEGLVVFSLPGSGPIAREVLLVTRRGHPRRALIGDLVEVFRELDLPLSLPA
jgi:LysR family hydrogen peroxide-inducible transcriptional activator